MLNSMLDSITSRAEEVEAGMVSRERHVKIWKESIEKDTSALQVKEEEFSNLLAEHKGLDIERNELIDERAQLEQRPTLTSVTQ